MNSFFFVLFFLLCFAIIYSDIKLLYFFLAFIFLLFLIYFSFQKNNHILLVISILFLIVLLPSLIFYIDLSLGVYPFLFYEKNKKKEMKQFCNEFLHRHFNIIEINKEISHQQKPVIFLLNHHTAESKILDYFCTLTIPEENSIVVTGGVSRWQIIDNLYSNLNTIKLGKNSCGNLNMFLRECFKTLKKGNNLIIFPEGKFTNKKKDWRKLEQLQTGSFILSKKTNIPVIPVLISGNNHQYGFITNSNLVIKYLDPIYPSDFSNAEDMRDYCLQNMNSGLKTLN